jgi:peptidoglycan hydrolase-like protein with peptidoglycan-binding domain
MRTQYKEEAPVLVRLLSIFILVIAFSGCATTQMKTQNEQMGSRITDLEKSLQAKDAQIVDLQYQVKDLSSKIDTSKSAEPDQVSKEAAAQVEPVKISEVFDNPQIIRVKVSPEKIQRALKSAGVYTGPMDGKIGPATKAAIIEFQKSHGLKADGVLGKKTWEELKTYLK